MVALTLIIVLTSSWFTGIVGVHPIFGGKYIDAARKLRTNAALQLSWQD